MKNDPVHDHWLIRPGTIRGLWLAFIVVLVMLVLAQAVIRVKGYFEVDGWFGFGAAFGFLACFFMVVFAKGLGVFLKRREQYYDD